MQGSKRKTRQDKQIICSCCPSEPWCLKIIASLSVLEPQPLVLEAGHLGWAQVFWAHLPQAIIINSGLTQPVFLRVEYLAPPPGRLSSSREPAWAYLHSPGLQNFKGKWNSKDFSHLLVLLRQMTCIKEHTFRKERGAWPGFHQSATWAGLGSWNKKDFNCFELVGSEEERKRGVGKEERRTSRSTGGLECDTKATGNPRRPLIKTEM